MRKRKILLFGICTLMLSMSIVGCGKKEVKNRKSNPQEVVTQTTTEIDTSQSTETTEEVIVEKEIQVDYFNQQTCEFATKTLITTDDTYQGILDVMQKDSLLSSDIEILSTEVQSYTDNKKVLIVDFNKDLELYIQQIKNGQMILYSISNTFINNSDIDYVNFKVEGTTLAHNGNQYDLVGLYEPSNATQIDFTQIAMDFDNIEAQNTTALNTQYSPILPKIDMCILYQCVNDSTQTMLADYKDPSIFEKEFSQSGNVLISNALFYNNPPTAERKLNAEIEKALVKYRLLYSPQNYTQNQTLKDEMNNFIKNQTNEKIESVYETIPQDDKLYLLNALNISLDWTNGFDASKNIENYNVKDFTGQDQCITMMYSVEKAQYINTSNATGFIKDLTDGYKFVAILPADNVKQLQDINLKELMLSANENNVAIKMPQLDISYKYNIDNILINNQENIMTDGVGYNSLFEGVVDKISLGNVYNAINFNIGNIKTETTSEELVVQKEISLDKPFYYMIINDETSEVILVGHYGYMK